MRLPDDLRDAVESELKIQSARQLAKLTAELSQRYREDPEDGRTFIRSIADVRPMQHIACLLLSALLLLY